MKYDKLDDVPFRTNAVPPEGSVEIDEKEHDELVRLSIREEIEMPPSIDPLDEIRERLTKLEQQYGRTRTERS